MKFKIEAIYAAGGVVIDYIAIDPDHDPIGNPLFFNTKIERENGIDYLIGDYIGALALPKYSEARFKTLVSFGELKDLFGMTGFVKVHRAAYPTGSKTPDDMALFFFERAKDPTHPSGKIDLSDPILDQGLQYFISKGYITTDDAARIKQGVKL